MNPFLHSRYQARFARGLGVVLPRNATSVPSPESQSSDSRIERCEQCNEETPHRVSLSVREQHTTRASETNQKYGRVPCRMTRCERCGYETNVRIDTGNAVVNDGDTSP